MSPKKGPGSKDEAINVAPGNDAAGAGVPRPPQNVTQAKAWQASRAGMNRAWSNYRQHLANSFKRMSRWEQEGLIQRLCLIVTIGVTGLALLLFYSLIDRTVRVLLVPAAMFAAWWAANKIVTPVVLARMDNLLNKE
jgi:hypothetical protein